MGSGHSIRSVERNGSGGPRRNGGEAKHLVAERPGKLARHNVPGLRPMANTVLKGRWKAHHNQIQRPFRTQKMMQSNPGAMPRANFLQALRAQNSNEASKWFPRSDRPHCTTGIRKPGAAAPISSWLFRESPHPTPRPGRAASRVVPGRSATTIRTRRHFSPPQRSE
jgi:hypothetical protein